MIVLITPSERHRLPALKDAGFAGYLVKPIRAASLKAQLVAAPVFDSPAAVEPEAFSAFEQAIAGLRKPLNVLVAEDNEINALLARALLTRLGHQPDHRRERRGGGGIAAAPPASSRLALRSRPDGQDARALTASEATRRIRGSDGDGARSHADRRADRNAFGEDREACLSGMDGFLVKRLDRDRLAERPLAARIGPKSLRTATRTVDF